MKVLEELLHHLCILTTVIFTFHVLSKNRKGFISVSAPLGRRIQLAVNMGLLGTLLMLSSIRLEDTILDLREIPVIIAAIYGGLVPSIVASLIVATGRMVMFPIHDTSVIGCLIMVITGLSFAALSQLHWSKFKKLLMMMFIHLVLVTVSFYVLIHDKKLFMNTSVNLWVITFVGGILIYFLTEYLRKSKELFQSAEENVSLDNLLQRSLDRFSKDLLGVVQVGEMERRLVKEVQDVLLVSNVSIIETRHPEAPVINYGSEHTLEYLSQQLELHDLTLLPLCKVVYLQRGVYIIKMAEISGRSYVLFVGADGALLLAKKIWLQTITRYASSLYENFRVIEDLTEDIRQPPINRRRLHGCSGCSLNFPRTKERICPRICMTMPCKSKSSGTANWKSFRKIARCPTPFKPN